MTLYIGLYRIPDRPYVYILPHSYFGGVVGGRKSREVSNFMWRSSVDTPAFFSDFFHPSRWVPFLFYLLFKMIECIQSHPFDTWREVCFLEFVFIEDQVSAVRIHPKIQKKVHGLIPIFDPDRGCSYVGVVPLQTSLLVHDLDHIVPSIEWIVHDPPEAVFYEG